MEATPFHLVQLNIARPKAPMESEFMSGFNALLDPVNAIADASPGFVWRLQTDEGNATGGPHSSARARADRAGVHFQGALSGTYRRAPRHGLISLVIFDCDGVLVDSEPISCRVMAEALTDEGLPYTTQECMHDYMGRAWGDSLQIIERKLGRPPADGFTERFRARRDAALAEEVTAIEGVRDAIDAIEAESCVASSGTHSKIRLTLGTTGLLSAFEERIFSAAEVERGKPAPDLFLHAARTMGHKTQHCAVVEDTPVGVEAARAAGMAALGFVDNADERTLQAAGATATFADMRELPKLIERL